VAVIVQYLNIVSFFDILTSYLLGRHVKVCSTPKCLRQWTWENVYRLIFLFYIQPSNHRCIFSSFMPKLFNQLSAISHFFLYTRKKLITPHLTQIKMVKLNASKFRSRFNFLNYLLWRPNWYYTILYGTYTYTVILMLFI